MDSDLRFRSWEFELALACPAKPTGRPSLTLRAHALMSEHAEALLHEEMCCLHATKRANHLVLRFDGSPLIGRDQMRGGGSPPHLTP